MPSENQIDKKKECILLWSTQSGRAKACARRCARMIRSHSFRTNKCDGSNTCISIIGKEDIHQRKLHHHQQHHHQDSHHDERAQMMQETDNVKSHLSWSFMNSGTSFDDFGAENLISLGSIASKQPSQMILIMFVSTTGDAEHCDSIQECWNTLLQKSLPSTLFSSIQFCIFALGDRAYGPSAFCAAGRKLARRLVQLGGKPACGIGYGDDGTPKGGIFADLDIWIQDCLLPIFPTTPNDHQMKHVSMETHPPNHVEILKESDAPYCVDLLHDIHSNGTVTKDASAASNSKLEVQEEEFQEEEDHLYNSYFFQMLAPRRAYQYDSSTGHRISMNETSAGLINSNPSPMKGTVISNTRITAKDWTQDVRHIRIQVQPFATTNPHTDRPTSQPQPQPATESSPLFHSHPLTSISKAYDAGDVAVILPQNSFISVQNFIRVLPPSIQRIADVPLIIRPRHTVDHYRLTPWPSIYFHNNHNDPNDTSDTSNTSNKTQKKSTTQSPTLRTLLTSCAAINTLPEREDLYTLSYFCQYSHPNGKDQALKLREMSEPSSDLYVDYILREKRTFVDLLFDFDSIGNVNCDRDDIHSGSGCVLTIEFLLGILPPLLPRAYSIASSPLELQYYEGIGIGNNDMDATVIKQNAGNFFDLELCIGVVSGTTPFGRPYQGVCTHYLASLDNSCRGSIRLWIRPGSFTKLPLQLRDHDVNGRSFQRPVLCIGAGTGIAPLRSILREREVHQREVHQREVHQREVHQREVHQRIMKYQHRSDDTNIRNQSPSSSHHFDNMLCFGCRKGSQDFCYANEWKDLHQSSTSLFELITAFSQDQKHKIYVQRKIRDAEHSNALISRHILEHGGAIYIAGGAKMAKAVKDEIIECLSGVLDGGTTEAKHLLKLFGRKGLFSVEAWS